MKHYDVICPVCGYPKRIMNAHETGGWLFCDHCLSEILAVEYLDDKRKELLKSMGLPEGPCSHPYLAESVRTSW